MPPDADPISTRQQRTLIARRWRRLWLALFLLLIAAFGVSWGRRVSLFFPEAFGLWLDNGVLFVGFSEDIGSVPGFNLEPDPYGSGFAGWRPVRYSGVNWNYIGFPLWQPIVLLGICAAYCHGFIAGVRWGDPSRCFKCGYSLRGLPVETGTVRCPECGMRSPA